MKQNDPAFQAIGCVKFNIARSKLQMKWKKLGHIFAPNGEHEWMHSHATCPVPYYLGNDIYRIYFSSRNPKNSANIVWIEVNINNPTKIIGLSEKSVFPLGELGCFDDSGIILSCISKHNNLDYWYYIGWNLGVTVPFRNSTGLAIFSNQEIIKRYPGPVLDRSKNEPHFATNPFVIPGNNVWKMWYLSCDRWEQTSLRPKHFYNIKYAESVNGIDWDPQEIIAIDYKDESEYAISRPCVIIEKNKYHMWYSYRGDKYRIGYAESEDGKHWERLDHLAAISVSENGWDSESIEYPYVFDHNGQRYMLYNGNDFGRTGFGLAVLES